MPRKGRGGKVEGAAQTAYAQRTDLAQKGPEPVTTAPGEPYGQRQMLEDAQKAVPMSGTPGPVHSSASSAQSQSPALPEPGTIPWMHESQRPWENSGDRGQAQPLHPAIPPPQAPVERLADVLQAAASGPYATPMIQELAALAASVKA